MCAINLGVVASKTAMNTKYLMDVVVPTTAGCCGETSVKCRAGGIWSFQFLSVPNLNPSDWLCCCSFCLFLPFFAVTAFELIESFFPQRMADVWYLGDTFLECLSGQEVLGWNSAASQCFGRYYRQILDFLTHGGEKTSLMSALPSFCALCRPLWQWEKLHKLRFQQCPDFPPRRTLSVATGVCSFAPESNLSERRTLLVDYSSWRRSWDQTAVVLLLWGRYVIFIVPDCICF